VYIAYLDDSGSTGGNLADPKAPYQLIGALLLRDINFTATEILLAETIDNAVPAEDRASFEFHAADLWHGNPPFDRIPRDVRLQALRNCLITVSGLGMPVIYGAVDKTKLSQQIYSSASPLEIAFRLCLEGVENWLKQSSSGLALIIADDTKDNKAKNAMKNAFRTNRRQMRSMTHNRGRLAHILDDMFFGNSGDSIGIQLIDVCNFFIQRHLRNDDETEHFYQMIARNVHGTIFPE
jgi:hypothetical protein